MTVESEVALIHSPIQQLWQSTVTAVGKLLRRAFETADDKGSLSDGHLVPHHLNTVVAKILVDVTKVSTSTYSSA